MLYSPHNGLIKPRLGQNMKADITTFSINEIIKTHPVIFVTRDIERAMGRKPGEGYYVITNSSTYSESIKALFPDYVTIISAGKILDTAELLEHDEVVKKIKSIASQISRKAEENSKPNILVFKNTPKIERICEKNKWNLLNPSAKLADQIESKISQVEWLENNGLDKFLPTHYITQIGSLQDQIDLPDKLDKTQNGIKPDPKYVLQFNHGHTGESTIFLRQKSDLQEIVDKFPKREVRITKYIKGPMFTVNSVVFNNPPQIKVGNISYQITGLEPFTDHEGTTIGNDWSLVSSILDTQSEDSIREVATEIGLKLAKSGWKGAFGIDIIFDFIENRPCLIEINARQCASVTFESIIQTMFEHAQENDGEKTDEAITIFDSHILALIDSKERIAENSFKIIQINDGSQIIQRVTKNFPEKDSDTKIIVNGLRDAGFGVIEYEIKESNDGSDALRIQSPHGIMAGHEQFNARGKAILKILEDTK